MTTLAGRSAVADDLWSGLTARLPAGELGRIGGALPAQPWCDPATFAFRDLFEAHHEDLRDELIAALAERLPMHPFGRAPDGAPLPTGAVPAGWNELERWWRTAPVASACAVLRRAAAIMREVVAETKVLSRFSYLALEPGTREHTDPINALASCHHDTWNDHPTVTRLVLAVHGPHPDLTVVERDALAWLAERLLGPG